MLKLAGFVVLAALSVGTNKPEDHDEKATLLMCLSEKADPTVEQACSSVIMRIGADPDAVLSAYAARASVRMQLEDTHGAVADCYLVDQKVKEKQGDGRGSFCFGYIYLLQGRNELAISFMNRALLVDPGNALYWYIRGVLYESAGLNEVALLNYRRAVQSWPGDTQALDAISRLDEAAKSR